MLLGGRIFPSARLLMSWLHEDHPLQLRLVSYHWRLEMRLCHSCLREKRMPKDRKSLEHRKHMVQLQLLGRVYPENPITVRHIDELCNVPGEPCYRLTICNAGDGVVYHRQSARSPPKLKYQTCHLAVNHVWKVTGGRWQFCL